MLKNNFYSSADADGFNEENVVAAIEMEQMLVRLEKEFRRDLASRSDRRAAGSFSREHPESHDRHRRGDSFFYAG